MDPWRSEAWPGPEGVKVACFANRTLYEGPTHVIHTHKCCIQYRQCHSHNTPGREHNSTCVNPIAGKCATNATQQREQVQLTSTTACYVYIIYVHISEIQIEVTRYGYHEHIEQLIRKVNNINTFCNDLFVTTVCVWMQIMSRDTIVLL